MQKLVGRESMRLVFVAMERRACLRIGILCVCSNFLEKFFFALKFLTAHLRRRLLYFDNGESNESIVFLIDS